MEKSKIQPKLFEEKPGSEILKDFPTEFDLMFKNKEAKKSHDRKKNYKQKYGR